MVNKILITSAAYDGENDTINVSVQDSNKKHIAAVEIDLRSPVVKTGVATIEIDFNAPVVNTRIKVSKDAHHPFVNDVVLSAAVVATLYRHTTDEIKNPRIIDIHEPLEVTL